jgi:nucleoside-diphosphate-sugar epimerase
MMKKITVTGGSGKAGRATIVALQNAGYEVRNLDRVAPARPLCPTWQVDLTDYGQTIDALAGTEAVVHLAAIPNTSIHAPERTFRENTLSTFNVFQSAQTLGLKRVVWASSETTLGLPFKAVVPEVAPVTEEHYPYPESTYSLSKVVGESMAAQFARWSGIPFVGLRFSNVMEPPDYVRFAEWQDRPALRRWNMWGYVDARDVGESCRLGLEADLTGSENFIIAAADTCMLRPNVELLAAEFPGCALRPGTGPHDTLLAIAKARRLLGYAPHWSWRDPASAAAVSPR